MLIQNSFNECVISFNPEKKSSQPKESIIKPAQEILTQPNLCETNSFRESKNVEQISDSGVISSTFTSIIKEPSAEERQKALRNPHDREQIKCLLPWLKTLTPDELVDWLSYKDSLGQSRIQWSGSIEWAASSSLLKNLSIAHLIKLILQNPDAFHFEKNLCAVVSLVDNRSTEEIIQFLSMKNLEDDGFFLFSLKAKYLMPLFKKLTIDQILTIKNSKNVTCFHNTKFFRLLFPRLREEPVDTIVRVLTLKNLSPIYKKTPFNYCERECIDLINNFNSEQLKTLFSNKAWLQFINENQLSSERVLSFFEKLSIEERVSFLESENGTILLHDLKYLIKSLLPWLNTLTPDALVDWLSYKNSLGQSRIHWSGSIEWAASSSLLNKLSLNHLIKLMLQNPLVFHLKKNLCAVVSLVDNRSTEEIIQFLSMKNHHGEGLFLFSLKAKDLMPLFKKLTIDQILTIKDSKDFTFFHKTKFFPLFCPRLREESVDTIVRVLTLKNLSPTYMKTPFNYSEQDCIDLINNFNSEQLKTLFANKTWLQFINENQLNSDLVLYFFEKLSIEEQVSFLESENGIILLHDLNYPILFLDKLSKEQISQLMKTKDQEGIFHLYHLLKKCLKAEKFMWSRVSPFQSPQDIIQILLSPINTSGQTFLEIFFEYEDFPETLSPLLETLSREQLKELCLKKFKSGKNLLTNDAIVRNVIAIIEQKFDFIFLNSKEIISFLKKRD